ncbi:aminotransferase class I/II-fold pyridoxal phosphate-dependent enzyme [Acidimicrobiaceae bacterium USS-CC1]|uniref:Aminotransferase class I/II-fold pyridoxal phosphate-dependent enzyme n=1 Tax=Acidiferrimicrobium australe TaxID=2664430 RepID=A0ABW9QSF5_9ACTN|nr:aminotransferase class I/II-fold pyridoxal phosphate-dependent enzyme [Acidiferrimicrobium australe]
MSRILLSPPHMGDIERQMLLDAFDSNWIAPVGPDIDAFEREFAEVVGVPHAAALSSGTAGLHLALRLLGVGPGDEVIVPTLTFIATAAAVTYVGAKPVLLDSELATWNLDPDLLAEELAAAAKRGKLPAAVIAVDLYGQCADYDRIVPLCEEYGVPLIEDAAEALGATYRGRPAGSFGRIGVFSFNGNKIITTSGGGMLVSRDGDLVARARNLASQARMPVVHYQHEEIGYNYRLSNLLAALGRAQLRSLPDRVRRKREIFAFYRGALADVPGIDFMPIDPAGEPTCWLTCILVDPDEHGMDREKLRLHLDDEGIESRPVWKPLHRQPALADARCEAAPVAEHLFARGLCLPSGSSMTPADLGRVVGAIGAVPKWKTC